MLFNYLELLNRKIVESKALPQKKPTKSNPSLQMEMETKHTSTGAYKQGKLSENFYPTIKILTKKFKKVSIGIVVNLLTETPNPKQPEKNGFASLFATLVISEKWTNGRTKACTILWSKDENLGVFHEVSLINIAPMLTYQMGTVILHVLRPGKFSKLQRLRSDKLHNIFSWIHLINFSELIYSSSFRIKE